MELKRVVGLLLPEGLEDYYDLVDIEELKDKYILHLDEQNRKPNYLDKGVKITSKGFFDARTIRDFPLRGKPCYLKIRRRKWWREDTGETIFNNWQIISKGTRMTVELAAFLKEVDRQYSH